MNYFETLNDGAPCEGKLSCTVLSGGKSGDGIKGLPIAIRTGHPVRVFGFYPDRTAVHLGHRGRVTVPMFNFRLAFCGKRGKITWK